MYADETPAGHTPAPDEEHRFELPIVHERSPRDQPPAGPPSPDVAGEGSDAPPAGADVDEN
jgi:hypothetical protein